MSILFHPSFNSASCAAVNINRIFVDFLQNGKYQPSTAKKTLSNAMDVGDPSNFSRLTSIFPEIESMRQIISGRSISDEATMEGIKTAYMNYGYTFDPHGAVGFIGTRDFLSELEHPYQTIILETAHPAKFAGTVESAIGIKIEIPKRLKSCLDKKKDSVRITGDFSELKSFLLD